MKRRIFTAALVLAVTLLLGGALFGCGHETHDWGTGWVEDKAATCTEEGSRHRTCTECGKTETEVTPKSAHTIVKDDAVEATCSVEGKTAGSHCGVCGTVIEEQKTVAKKEHTPVTEEGYEATCDSDGLTNGSRCGVCGTVLQKQDRIPALNHEWKHYGEAELEYEHIPGTSKHRRVCNRNENHYEEDDCVYEISEQPATCETPATLTKTCSACGDVQEEITSPRLGHNWGDWEQVPDSDTHRRVCSNATTENCVETEQCEMIGDYLAATCEAPGYSHRHCARCDREENEEFEELGHSWGECVYLEGEEGNFHQQTCANDPNHVLKTACELQVDTVEPTCDTDGYTASHCIHCNYVGEKSNIREAFGHDYKTPVAVPGENYHKLVCTHDENHYLEVDCHYTTNSKDPTCTEPGYVKQVCDICGGENLISERPALDHAYGPYHSNMNGTHTSNCSRCGQPVTNNCEYIETRHPATCTDAGYTAQKCRYCSYDGPNIKPEVALGHDFKNFVHNPSLNTHTGTCSRQGCTETQTEPCTFNEIVTSPTCNDGGYTTYACKSCSNSYVGAQTEKLGHQWSTGWKYDMATKEHYHSCTRTGCTETQRENCTFDVTKESPATCFYAAYKEYTCSTCEGTYREETAKANGHTWAEDYKQMMFGGVYYHTRYCSVCNAVEGYTPCSMQTRTTDPTCEEDGKSIRECATCHKGTETVTKQKLGHNLSKWESNQAGKHTQKCLRPDCQYSVTEDCSDHMTDVSLAATCVSDGYVRHVCSKCQYTQEGEHTNALQHSYTNGYNGYEQDGSSGHKQVCTRCGHTEREECNFTDVTKDPTCEEDGSITRTCDKCNRVVVVTLPKGAHDFTGSEVTITNETHSGTCRVCKKQITEPHDYKYSNRCRYCQRDGLTYEVKGDYAIVKNDDAVPGAENIVIAATVQIEGQEYTVKEIGAFAFNRHESIRTLTIPITIELIDTSAFLGCKNLESVTVDAHDGQESNLKTIGSSAFQGCTSLRSAANLPSSLKTIDSYAFQGCTALNDIVIHENIEMIGSNAFQGSGKYIEWERGGTDAFYIGKHLIKVRSSVSGTFTIEEGTLTVGAYAFENCNITGLVVPVSLKVFDDFAFKDCNKLTEVRYKGTLLQWLAIVFDNDTASPVHVGQSGESAETFTFHVEGGADNDGVIEVSGEIPSIPAGTFKGDNITSVTIENGVTSIGAEAFMNCTNLETIVIPDSVVSIGRNAFYNTKLYNDWLDSGEDVLYIDNHLIKVKETATSVTIKSTTVTIGHEAFKGCTHLTSLSIPESVKWVGAEAFTGCSGLESFTLEGTNPGFFCEMTGQVAARYVTNNEFAGGKEKVQSTLYYYQGEWRRSR